MAVQVAIAEEPSGVTCRVPVAPTGRAGGPHRSAGPPVESHWQLTTGAPFVELFQEPMKPQEVEAPVARDPFHAAFRAVTVEPDWLTSAPHAWVTVCPFAKVSVTVQLESGCSAVTSTLPWNPPGHWPVTE